MCNPDYIFWTASEAFGRWFAPQTKRFWTVIKLKNVFLHVFLTKLMPFPPFFLPSLPVNSLIFSQFLTLSSPLPSTKMCLHRWSFIEKGLFGNPSGVI